MNELAKIYETASNPGSFGGVDALYREAKRNKLKVTKKTSDRMAVKQTILHFAQAG